MIIISFIPVTLMCDSEKLDASHLLGSKGHWEIYMLVSQFFEPAQWDSPKADLLFYQNCFHAKLRIQE